MRIISKFFDVYDLQHSLRDDSRVWKRKTETLKVRKLEGEDYGFNFDFFARNLDKKVNFSVNFFYFCGTVYPLFSFRHWENSSNYKTTKIENALHYANTVAGIKALNYRFPGDTLEKQFAKLDAAIQEQLPRIKEMFDKFNHPLGIYNYSNKELPDEESTQEVPCHILTFNPQLLGNLPWQEIDSNVYRFHQLVEQYLSGVIGYFEATPKTVTTSDKDRLIAHGFDAVTSFRKM